MLRIVNEVQMIIGKGAAEEEVDEYSDDNKDQEI